MPLDEHTTDDLGWNETGGADGQYLSQSDGHAAGNLGPGLEDVDPPQAPHDGGDLGGDGGDGDEESGDLGGDGGDEAGDLGGDGDELDQEGAPAPRRSRANKVITAAGCGVALVIAFFGYQYYQQTHGRHIIPTHPAAVLHATHPADATLPTRLSAAASAELGGSMSAPIMPQPAGAGTIEAPAGAPTALPRVPAESNTASAAPSSASLPSIRQNAPAIAGMTHPGAVPPALMKAIDSQGAMLKALLKSTSATSAAERNAQAVQAKEIIDLETKLGTAQADITKMSEEVTTLQATLAEQQANMTAEKAATAKPERAATKAAAEKHIHHAAATLTRKEHVTEGHHQVPHHIAPDHVLTGWSLTMVSRTTDQVEAPGGRREFVRPGQSVKGLGVIGHVVPYRTPAGVSSYQLFTSEGRILPRLGR